MKASVRYLRVKRPTDDLMVRNERPLNLAQRFFSFKNRKTNSDKSNSHHDKYSAIKFAIFHKHPNGYLLLLLNDQYEIKKAWNSSTETTVRSYDKFIYDIIPVKSKLIKTEEFKNILSQYEHNLIPLILNDGTPLSPLRYKNVYVYDKLNLIDLLTLLNEKGISGLQSRILEKQNVDIKKKKKPRKTILGPSLWVDTKPNCSDVRELDSSLKKISLI